jgi:small redox-active disulfide protein 2
MGTKLSSGSLTQLCKLTPKQIRRETMLIQVLGTGCAKCTKLADLAEEAAKKMGVDYTIEKITAIDKIMAFGVMVTPALVIDGKVLCSGNVPSVEQIVTILTQ